MATSTFNRENLIERILEKHRRIDEGQGIVPEDRDKADGVIDPVCAELEQRRVIVVNPDQSMPIAIKEHLSEVCAFHCAKDFGRVPDAEMLALAESRLRAIDSSGPTFEPQQVDLIHQRFGHDLEDYGPW